MRRHGAPQAAPAHPWEAGRAGAAGRTPSRDARAGGFEGLPARVLPKRMLGPSRPPWMTANDDGRCGLGLRRPFALDAAPAQAGHERLNCKDCRSDLIHLGSLFLWISKRPEIRVNPRICISRTEQTETVLWGKRRFRLLAHSDPGQHRKEFLGLNRSVGELPTRTADSWFSVRQKGESR